jgi:outer membrane protein TolC
LAALTDLALRNSAATRVAWNAARAAAEQVRHAQGYFMPSLTAGAGATRRNTDSHPETHDQNYLKYGPGLELNYLVLNFGGGRDAAVEQALQTVYAANFGFNRAIQDALLATTLAYHEVVAAEAGIQAAAAGVRDTTAILDAARERRLGGLGVELDELQARAAHDGALYTLAAAEGRCQFALGALAQAVGLPADTPLQVAPPAPHPAADVSESDLRRLMDDALGRRADIAALRAGLRAREAAVQVARAARSPSLYLNGAITRDYNEPYGESNNPPMASDTWGYTAGVNLKWNLFDGFQTRSEIRAAEADADAARARLTQAELAASAEVWTRHHAYRTALRKLAASEALLASAAGAHALALDSYKAGVRSLLDLLDAELRLAQARHQQVAARQEVRAALASLAHATGTLVHNP